MSAVTDQVGELFGPVELVRTYGGVISHAALEDACSHYSLPGTEGMIGYRRFGDTAVVYGDPVCAAHLVPRFIDAFQAHCVEHGWSTLYVAASQACIDHGIAHGHAAIEFAQALQSDAHDPEGGHEGRHLRQKCNRVRRAGVEVHTYAARGAPEPDLEKKLLAAVDLWRASRRGPQAFLGRPRWFADRAGRRWLYAKQDGRVVGVLSMMDVSAPNGGKLINNVIAIPGAPTGTAELLVVAALEALRDEGLASVCLGLAPLPRLGAIVHLGPIGERAARASYAPLARLLHLDGKREFWSKFAYVATPPLYLMLSPSRSGWRSLLALARVFNFSLASALTRQPASAPR